MSGIPFTLSSARRTSRLRLRLCALLCTAATLALSDGALAASNIDNGKTDQSSDLGGSVNPDFKGGTLQISNTDTITSNFAVENFAGNTIDADGHVATMSGAFTGARRR